MVSGGIATSFLDSIGWWVSPREDFGRYGEVNILDLLGLKHRLFGRQAHSQSLYRLSYPGS
jgi:hypothetical protein